MLTVKKLVYICTNFMRGNTYIQNYIIMNKKLSLYVLAGAAIVLTGCNKKMSPFASEYFSTDPTPLEVVGDAVPATITANVPQKFFKKNAEVTVTPYLLFGDSQKVTSKSGRASFKTSPGKPAPVPTSMIFAFCGKSANENSERLSAKCFTATPCSSVIAVRLIFSFHSTSKSKYCSSIFS